MVRNNAPKTTITELKKKLPIPAVVQAFDVVGRSSSLAGSANGDAKISELVLNDDMIDPEQRHDHQQRTR